MSLRIGLGFSQNPDAERAAQEASDLAKIELGEQRIDFAFLFSTQQYNPKDFLPIVYESLDGTRIIGSSTAGILLKDRIETQGIGILVFHSDDIHFETGHVEHINFQDPREAGKILIKESISGFGRKQRQLFLIFADGLLSDIDLMADGVKEEIGGALPIIGAGSSDHFHYDKTYQFFHDSFLMQSAAAVMIGGKISLGISCKHGWKPLGKPRTIDQVSGNIIKSISGQKASHIYEEFFEKEALISGKKNKLNLRYPLGIHCEGNNQYLLRNVVSTLDDGSIVCQDAVKAGAEVHIMIGNREFCIQAAEEAAMDVKLQLKGRTPASIIVLESMIRYQILGRNAALEEIKTIQKILGSAPVMGMYSCNEIFSHMNSNYEGETQLHNGSIIILAFY